MSALRFWCTPGEAWIRLMARLHGVRAVVSSEGSRSVEFEVALSPDQRRMRIRLNDEFIVLDQVRASQVAEAMRRTVSEMVAEPSDG